MVSYWIHELVKYYTGSSDCFPLKNARDFMHWEDPEGAGGEGGGRGDRDAEHMSTHGCFISMYDKTHYNKKNLKNLKKFKKKKNAREKVHYFVNR